MEKYTPIIGLEIHIEQNTVSKMFCQCRADYFGAEPNTHTCPVCLGMPGALPVPNIKAIRNTILLGKALNCEINSHFKFDRKNYFYHDLPKGYQISQYDEPIAQHGKLTIKTEQGEKSFGITRIHLEEDTGKLTHERGEEGDSLVDFNRSGVPLMEIVTEPDFHDSEDVRLFLEELQVIVRYLGIANADMEKGDMRLEPNISAQLTVKLPELPPYKVEVKNINSFRFAKKAIEYEIERQIEILEEGKIPVQETRGYDNRNDVTVSQRIKEEAADYRYFPEPDIPPFTFEQSELDEIYKTIPELPYSRFTRFMKDWELKEADAQFLTRDRQLADRFEALVTGYAEQSKLELPAAAQLIAKNLVNKKIAIEDGVDKVVKVLAEQSAPKETDEDLLAKVTDDVLAQNAKAVQDFKSGKNPNAVMFIVGQVMRGMQGKADASRVKEYLLERIK